MPRDKLNFSELWSTYKVCRKNKIRDDFKIKSTKTGIDFLGYIVKPTHTLVRNRVVNNFKYKKAKLLEDEGNINTIKYKELVSSYKAHFKHANGFNLINNMLNTKDIL